MNKSIFATATELAAAVRRRQISAVEVLDRHLAHIARHNSAVNAIVTLDEPGARQRARAADDALAHGEIWGPLHGVPVTFKNIHSVAGVLGVWGGHPDYAKRIPSEDSAMPARLRQAGAIILGLTNSDVFGSNVFGRTNNPWDLDRSPNGSSSGSAAAVAAGLSPLDIGGDSLGSILEPASFCGVFGMRPTEHRVSNAGLKVFGTPHTFQPLTVSGPLARSVEDMELALRVITGPDGRDMDVPPVPWREATGAALPGLRIAWSHTFPKMPLAKDIYAAVEGLMADLAHQGARTQQTLPELDFVKEHELGWQFMRFTWEDLFRADGGITSVEPPLQLDDFYKAVVQREALVRIWEQFFTQWDVFICPVEMQTASRHADTDLIVDGKTYTWNEVSHSTRSISPLTGLPAVAMPVGLDSQGLPMGIQLIGRRWEDERLLAVARLVSQFAGGFRAPSGY